MADRRFDEIMDHPLALPRDPVGYGLIHQDTHTGNLFLAKDGQMTLFDLNDCCYGWYIYDIALVLFYAVMWQPFIAALITLTWTIPG